MERYEIAVETVSAESAEDACRNAVRNFAGRCRPVIIPDPEIKLEQIGKEIEELERKISLAKHSKEKHVLEIKALERRADNLDEQASVLHRIINPPMF